MSAALRLLLAAVLGAAAFSATGSAAVLKGNTAMKATPSADRPPPPDVPPIVHKGVRYEQDLGATAPAGTAAGGLLAAFDHASNARLWQLQVYTVVDRSPPGLSAPERYFHAMALVPGRDALWVDDETGSRYLVDLNDRTSTKLSGPPDFDPPAPPRKAKPKP